MSKANLYQRLKFFLIVYCGYTEGQLDGRSLSELRSTADANGWNTHPMGKGSA